MKKLFIILVAVLLIPASIGAFDKERGKELSIEDVGVSFVSVFTIGEASGVYWDHENERRFIKRGTFLLEGSGFVLENGYVATAGHVVEPRSVMLRVDSCIYHQVETVEVIWSRTSSKSS